MEYCFDPSNQRATKSVPWFGNMEIADDFGERVRVECRRGQHDGQKGDRWRRKNSFAKQGLEKMRREKGTAGSISCYHSIRASESEILDFYFWISCSTKTHGVRPWVVKETSGVQLRALFQVLRRQGNPASADRSMKRAPAVLMCHRQAAVGRVAEMKRQHPTTHRRALFW